MEKGKELCRSMAMIQDGESLLSDFLSQYDDRKYIGLKVEGKRIVNNMFFLHELQKNLIDDFQDSIDDAAEMSGYDINEIGYEDNLEV